MIRTRGANRTLHRIIRGIVLLNFILLVVDSNALPSFQDLIRRNQFVTPLSYWVEISILSVIGLLLVQPILRAYQRAKTPVVPGAEAEPFLTISLRVASATILQISRALRSLEQIYNAKRIGVFYVSRSS